MFFPVGTQEESTPRLGFPVVTTVLVALNSLVFLFELFLLLVGGEQALNTFIPTSPIPTVGASGAIAGVLAGYILLFPRGKVRVFFFLGPLSRTTRLSALLFVGVWFVTQFFNGMASLGVATAETAGVAYWAHIGGFASGLVLASFFKLFPGLRSAETALAS